MKKTQTVDVVLMGSGGELDRYAAEVEDVKSIDPSEIYHVIRNWTLAVGDSIKIVEFLGDA